MPSISAHWFVPEIGVTVTTAPKTIHDFGGFPTPDHYLPLLYVIATRQEGEAIGFPIAGVDGGSISMLTVQIGQQPQPV